MFEFREIKSETEYKPLELNLNTPFTQAWFFGEWQGAMGRKIRRFEIKKDSEIFGFFQSIKYLLPFGQSFLYIPHGPVLTHNTQHATHNSEFLKEFHKKLTQIAKEENAIFIRFDFCLPRRSFSEGGADLSKFFKKVPEYAYHSSYFQPKFEWVLNLERPEEEILNEMHPKTRYNIGLAARRGIKIEIISENFGGYFNDFYKLLEETAQRDNFSLHPKVYYENIFVSCEENKNAFLSVTKYNSKILAINLILLFGKTAFFLFGGSSDEHKNLMAPYLAHWKALLESKQQGFKFYNFGGVDPSTSLRVNDGIYGTYGGISRFKKGFGGKLLEYSDSYDLVLKPFWYKIYNLRKWVLNLK